MKTRNIITVLFLSAFATTLLQAAPIKVVKQGAEKKSITIATAGGVAAAAYNKSLRLNLERSGYFKVAPNASIVVSGTPGASVEVKGPGKGLRDNATFSDDKAARMAARRLADAIVQNFTEGKGKGFATTRIAFVNRKGSDNAELYTCYPDGYDIRQQTSDKRAAVGPRWAPNSRDIYYTGFLGLTPQVYRVDTQSGARTKLADFLNGSNGAAISPDGRKCAIILNYQGNPDLYVLDLATKRTERMTNTKAAAEASPCWSPDGKKIAYVSDETRKPQIWIVDTATKQKRRFTSTGTENTNPDWGLDGRLAWASKRSGQSVLVVADPAAGEASARVVTAPGSWEHPSWAADSRHLVASRDKAIFLVDSDPEGDNQPVRVFYNEGNWMNPAFSR